MRKIYFLLFAIMLMCIGCEWQLKAEDDGSNIVIDRYDRIQTLYLTTSDFSALQQMNTVYPMQTRTLIEDVLRIGQVNDPQINTKFLSFYQDSTLQVLINEAEHQYANVDDINEALSVAFKYLKKELPTMEIPEIYAQIGSLDQSVIVGNGMIGICLDKYLGADYELYRKPEYGYSASQRSMMQRQYIVPEEAMTQAERDIHMGRIQWVVNEAIGKKLFRNPYVRRVEKYMDRHKSMTVEQLLSGKDYSVFL